MNDWILSADLKSEAGFLKAWDYLKWNIDCAEFKLLNQGNEY